eukprot:7152719-Prymnesium_polylepis.1
MPHRCRGPPGSAGVRRGPAPRGALQIVETHFQRRPTAPWLAARRRVTAAGFELAHGPRAPNSLKALHNVAMVTASAGHLHKAEEICARHTRATRERATTTFTAHSPTTFTAHSPT